MKKTANLSLTHVITLNKIKHDTCLHFILARTELYYHKYIKPYEYYHITIEKIST